MFVQLRGHQVHALSYGSGATTVVGVSGAFGNCEIWEQPFELLSTDHRVVAYDHFGTGETRVPPERVTFEEQVALVGDLLDAFEVDRCVLAADSNMVAVGVEAAARLVGRVDGLALVAGGVRDFRSTTVERFVAGLRADFDATIDAFVALCIPEEDCAHLRGWLRDIVARTGGERAATLLESFYGVDVSGRLPELAVPTVVVQGELDALPGSTVDAAGAMASSIPDCRMEVLPGVGHVPTLTRPAEVASIIRELARRAMAAT